MLLVQSILQIAESRGRVGAMKGTGADCFTFDSVPFDQREYEIRRLGECCVEPHTGIPSKDLFDLVGRYPKSRIDQADIPS